MSHYFKIFCALILIRKENLKRKKKQPKKENIAHLWIALFDNLPVAVSKSNVVTPMDCPVVVLKSDACFTVEFLNRFVHIRPDMACVLNKKEIKSEFRAYWSPPLLKQNDFVSLHRDEALRRFA